MNHEQRANLNKLADYLLALPDDYEYFNMINYCRLKNGVVPGTVFEGMGIGECGTVGCAIGHGPLAGIIPTRLDQTWRDYCHELLGVSRDTADFVFLFSSHWASHGGSAKAARLRIIAYLRDGVPPGFNTTKPWTWPKHMDLLRGRP